MKEHYGMDTGQSNLRIARVHPETGTLLSEVFEKPMADIRTTKELSEIIGMVIKEPANVGVCAAGDIDEEKLIVKEAPNSNIKYIDFGQIFFGKKHDVALTNDMKAAVSAEAMYGQGRDFENVLVATFSSGYNCAKATDRRVVTTAEFGHIPYKPEGDLFCGCGGRGHIEIYVSGNGAAVRAKQYFSARFEPEHPIIKLALIDYNRKGADLNSIGFNLSTFEEKDLQTPFIYHIIVGSIKAKHVYAAYRERPKQRPQREIRDDQVDAIAYSLGAMNSSYNPLDIMILMGSQTKDWDNLFVPAIIKYDLDEGNYQLSSLKKPKVVRTEMPEIGLQGAVAYAIQKKAK